MYFILLVYVVAFASACTDLTRTPESFGTDVVLACVRLIQTSGIFEDDHGFLRKVALLETSDGESAFTYSTGDEFNGGIWGVSKEAFDVTKSSTVIVDDHFKIRWNSTTYDDLRKPLFSALAARIYLNTVKNPLQLSNRTEQLMLWRSLTGGKREDSQFLSLPSFNESEMIEPDLIELGAHVKKQLKNNTVYFEADIENDIQVVVDFSSDDDSAVLFVSNLNYSSASVHCGKTNHGRLFLKPSEMFEYGLVNRILLTIDGKSSSSFHLSIAEHSNNTGNVNFGSESDEFIVGMFSNHPDANSPPVELLISTKESETVEFVIEDINGTIMSLTVNSTPTEVYLPSKYVVSSVNETQKGIMLKTKNGKKISVSVGSSYTYSTDSYHAIPSITYAGVEEYTYYGITPNTNATGLKSRLLLVGTHDFTKVVITPTQESTVVNDIILNANESFEIEVNRLETLLIESDLPLTGTKVVSNKPITFLSGHQCAVIPQSGNSCDFAIEQFPPTITYGKKFMFQMLSSRTGGSHFIVLTSENHTNVSLWCALSSTNQSLEHSFLLEPAGSYKALEIAPDDVICSLISDKPSVLAVLGTSENADENNGDPLLIMIPPVEQFSTALSYKKNENLTSTYVNLVVAGDYSNVLMDDAPLSSEWNEVQAPSLGINSFGFVTKLSVNDTSIHSFSTTSSDTNISALIYGFDFSVGYGRRAGMLLKPIANSFSSNSNLEIEEGNSSVSGSKQLTCLTGGIPAYVFTWEKAGKILTPSAKYSFSSSGYKDSVLTINQATTNDSGIYTCTFYTYYGDVGSLSTSYTLNVAVLPSPVPKLSSQEQEYGNTENESALVDVTVMNVDSRDYAISWRFTNSRGILADIDNITNPNKYILFESNNNWLLKVLDLQLGEHGIIGIAVRTNGGTAVLNVNLTVYVSVAINGLLENVLMKKVGEDVKFDCKADGINAPTITWKKNQNLLLNSNKYAISSETSKNGFRNIEGIMVTNSSIVIQSLVKDDEALYFCVATNNAEVSRMKQFTLEVEEDKPVNHCLLNSCSGNGRCLNLAATHLCICDEGYEGTDCETETIVCIEPRITTAPSNLRASLYSSGQLVCEATGAPIPVIQWFKNGEKIFNANDDQSVLIFPSIILDNRGIYHCTATSSSCLSNDISESAILDIRNVIQYEGSININSTAPINSSSLIAEINEELFGTSDKENQFFLIQESGTSSENLFPVILTVLVNRATNGNTSELLNIIRQRISALTLNQLISADLRISDQNRFDGCRTDQTVLPTLSNDTNLDIIIEWPETNIGEIVYVDCPCGGTTDTNLKASRYCGGDFISGGKWTNENVGSCNFSTTARRLCQLTELAVPERIQELETITSNVEALGTTEVIVSVSVLINTTDNVLGNETLTETFLDVADNILSINESILQDSIQIFNTSHRLQEAILNVADELTLSNNSKNVTVVRSTFAVSVQRISFDGFMGSNYSVTNTSDVQYSDNVNVDVNASISLPFTLFRGKFNSRNISRISNSVFFNDNAFLVRNNRNQEVGGYIVSARVVGFSRDAFQNLTDPVQLRFQRIEESLMNATNPQCVFFDTTADDGFGGWSTEGCQTVNPSGNIIECECNHLTSFSILLDVSPMTQSDTHSGHALTALSYIGLCTSMVCLIITILSYLSSKKLRSLETGQLLINLCVALMGLYITFIAAIHANHNIFLCSVIAAALHYFFLVTFMTMAVEAVSLYVKLVVVLGRIIQRFVVKGVIVSWIIPFFIVVFSFVPNYEHYVSDHFCRAYGYPFYVGMLLPFLVIYLFNWIVFILTVGSLAKQAYQKRKIQGTDNSSYIFVRQQLITAVILSTLLGVAWGIGIFATDSIHSSEITRDIISAVFVLVTAFHGVWIFLMHCLRSKEVRKQWKKLFYGVTRQEYTDVTTGTFSADKKKSKGERKKKLKNEIAMTSNSAYSYYNKSAEGSSEVPLYDEASTLKYQVMESEAEAEFDNFEKYDLDRYTDVHTFKAEHDEKKM